jgi:HEAT repeat protein
MRRAVLSAAVLLSLLLPATLTPAQPPRKGQIESDKKDKGDYREERGPTKVSGKAIEEWIKETKDADPSLRERAVRMLLLFGKEARDKANPVLISRLLDKDASVRTNAVIVLGLMGASDRYRDKAVDGLASRVINDPQAIVRYQAAWALGQWGAEAVRALPQLIKGTSDGTSWEIRKASIYAIGTAMNAYRGRLDAAAKQSYTKGLTALLSGLNDHTWEVRQEAAIALTSLGKPIDVGMGKTTLDRIRGRFPIESHNEVRIWLWMAFMTFDGVSDRGLAALAEYSEPQVTVKVQGVNRVRKHDVSTREQALIALGTLGQRAKPRLKDVLRAARDREPSVAIAAMMAMTSIDDYSDRVVQTLEALAKDDKASDLIKTTAKGYLERMKTEAKEGKDDKKDGKKTND